MSRRSVDIGITENLPQKVVALLVRDIEGGILEPGSRLPTEQQLSTRLGVSRNVIREAIAQLRADGLVEARQGMGGLRAGARAARGHQDRSPYASGMQATSSDCSSSEHAGDGSCTAGGHAAYDWTARGDQAHLDRMGGEEKWEDGSIDADLAFHSEVARATGNSYIHTFISFVCEQIRQTIYIARRTNPLHDLVRVNVAEHVRIYRGAAGPAIPKAAADSDARAHPWRGRAGGRQIRPKEDKHRGPVAPNRRRRINELKSVN
jgi:GntR family transcriptional regulator, transcriptional repressor for pyruvate dehydrogenase complex